MAFWKRTDGGLDPRVAGLEARLAALESRVSALEGQDVALAELRRQAANAIRSLTRHALNVQEAASGPNGNGRGVEVGPDAISARIHARRQQHGIRKILPE